MAVIALSVVAITAIAAITVATGGSAAVVFTSSIVGMTLSGTTSIITQASSNGFIDYSQLLVDMAFGGITGALGGSAFNMLGVAFGSSLSGFASSIASDWVSGNQIDITKAGISGLAGLVSGLISGAGIQKGLTGHTKKLMASRANIKSNINSYSKQGGKGALALMKYHIKNARNSVRAAGLFNLFSGMNATFYSAGLDAILSQII